MNASRLLALAAVATLTGCSNAPAPQPLSAGTFYRGETGDRRQQAADRGGAIVPGAEPSPKQAVPDQAGDVPVTPGATAEPGANSPAAQTPEAISPTVSDNVTAVAPVPDLSVPTPSIAPATAPNATPAKRPRVIPQYMTIGGVVAKVNGTPVYADAVLRAVAPLLAARAKDLDVDRFRSTANTEINRQVDELIRAEAEYAAADRNTVGADKDLAERLTAVDRQKLITVANGSIELARSRAREQGLDFDELMKQQYRLNLVRVYYQKKIFPRVQVTAQDMRRYYDQNRDRQFSARDTATYKVLSVSTKPDAAAARELINGLQLRAAAGEDFDVLIAALKNPPVNPNPGPRERNAWKYVQAEKAAWELEPGQVSPVIADSDALFVIKMLDKKLGTTQGFNDAAVQASIAKVLSDEQFNRLRRSQQEVLQRDAVINRNGPMVAATVDMAVQNYEQWRE